MRKIFTLLIVAILATATSWAAEVTKTYTFTDKSWSATDESGNPANWEGSKDGYAFNDNSTPKGVQITKALTGLTVTSPTAFSDVTKVIVCYNSSGSGVGSINVKVGDTNFDTKSISKGQTNANLSFAATGSGNRKGKVVITNTCKTSSFALVSVKVVYEGNSEPEKTVKSLAITGEPAQTEYTEGDAFSAEGLVVTATYDDASTAVVTADATWTFDPATMAVSTTSVTATAKYNEKTASETYNVTVKEIPSYTYTWMVNGAEVKKSVLKAGAAVEAPANPENIADKVFTGWVTTATVDANVAPTYATIDATAKANTTYYAVFATLKQGAGEKWVKKTASEITEGGVYALITEDGKAFNGEISGSYRGDGQSTVTAFEFVNNEATSAPEGTCELTFEKSEKAETDGNEGYNMINKATGKFLTSMDNSQGNLTWSVLEDSYWYSNNGWIF